MDVFSTQTPSSAAQTRVMLHNNTAARSYGKLVTDGTLGDMAFSTVYGQKYIYKINLAEKAVEKSISMDDGNPKFSGLYEMVYNPKNEHLFIRSQVCCTCGDFAEADSTECGGYGSANITLDGQDYRGQCGRHCNGGPADTVGVFEFDTVSETVVGNHAYVGSTGIDTPFTSPDGEYIIFFGLNGGKRIDILKPGANGEKSEVYTTLDMNFNSTMGEDDSVFNDFAFVQTADKNMFVVASATDFKLALVDMSKPDPTVEYITLSDKLFNEGDRVRSRQVEWVQGSNYVWVSGRTEEQVYVVDIVSKKVVKTFTEVAANKLVSVRSNQYDNMAEMVNQVFDENGVWEQHTQKVPAYVPPTTSEDSISSEDTEPALATSSANALNDTESSSNSNGLSIASLLISCVAIVAVLTNFYMSQTKGSSNDTVAGKKSTAPPSVA